MTIFFYVHIFDELVQGTTLQSSSQLRKTSTERKLVKIYTSILYYNVLWNKYKCYKCLYFDGFVNSQSNLAVFRQKSDIIDDWDAQTKFMQKILRYQEMFNYYLFS